jgi:hypothetical protein
LADEEAEPQSLARLSRSKPFHEGAAQAGRCATVGRVEIRRDVSDRNGASPVFRCQEARAVPRRAANDARADSWSGSPAFLRPGRVRRWPASTGRDSRVIVGAPHFSNFSRFGGGRRPTLKSRADVPGAMYPFRGPILTLHQLLSTLSPVDYPSAPKTRYGESG